MDRHSWADITAHDGERISFHVPNLFDILRSPDDYSADSVKMACRNAGMIIESFWPRFTFVGAVEKFGQLDRDGI